LGRGLSSEGCQKKKKKSSRGKSANLRFYRLRERGRPWEKKWRGEGGATASSEGRGVRKKVGKERERILEKNFAF